MSASISGRFSWNAGAIAGAALGASLWMPATAFASGWPVIGMATALTTASLVLLSALLLWRLRHRISAYQGLMVLLAVGFMATALFFAVAHVLDLSLVNGWPGGKSGSALSYASVLLLYPVIAIWMRFLNHPVSKQKPPAA